MLAKLHVTLSKAAAHAGLNWPSRLTNRPALLWAGPSLLPPARVPRETRGSAVQVPFPYRKGSSSSRTYINSLNLLLLVHLRRVQLVIPKVRVCSGISSYFRGSRQRFRLHGLSPASSSYNQRDALGCWSFLSTKAICFECWIWASPTPLPSQHFCSSGMLFWFCYCKSRACKSTIRKLHVRKLDFKHGLNKTTPNPS